MKRKSRGEASVPHPGGWRRRYLFAFGLVVLSIALAYMNSLNGTWAMDDVLANKPVGIHDIRDVIGFRKVAYLTFLLNQHIAPFSPANFRLFNIFIHTVTTFLVFLLAYKTIRLVSKKGGQEEGTTEVTGGRGQRSSLITDDPAFPAALLSSVIFGLHPININAVAYITQRMASLAAFFVILGLLFYSAASQTRKKIPAILFYIGSGVSLVLGIFSKENAVLGIPLFLLYDYLFLSRGDRKVFLPRAFVIVLIGIASIGLASYFLKLHQSLLDIAGLFLAPHETIPPKGWTAVDVSWTPLQHILTEFRIVSRYLFLIVCPLPTFLVFDRWGFPVSQGISSPVSTLISMTLVFLLFLFSLLCRKRLPLISFGILWYLVAISLESFFAVGSDLYFEHRNYLPVSGLIIGVVGQTVISLRGKIGERSLWTVAVALSLLLGGLTFSRNLVWKDSLSLWGDTLKKDPANIRAMMAMGNTYLKMSAFDDAERYYKQALNVSSREKRPSFLTDSAYTLGMLYLFKGQLEPAKELMERLDSAVESYKPAILRGFYKALKGDTDGALKEYHGIIGKTAGIDTIVVLTLTGDAYRAKNLFDTAIEYYTRVLSMEPDYSAAYYGIGLSYMAKRQKELARDYFEKTLFLDPDNSLALSDMADLRLIEKSPNEALGFAQKAISKSPPFHKPYLTMANVLIVLGREREAEDLYRKALEHGAPPYMIPFGKARSYYLRGDAEKTRLFLAELKKYQALPEEIRGIIPR